MKFKLAIIAAALVIAIPASAQTNLVSYYNAHSFELEGGLSETFANVKSHQAGVTVAGTYWQTLHYGTIVRAGINDVRAPNALIFDYTEAGESVRLIWWRFAPGATIYGGKSYVDGGTYTKLEAWIEGRFTKNWGAKFGINDAFSTSHATSGPGGYLTTTFEF